MTDTCYLSPPAGAGRAALQAHLRTLKEMDQNDPLVQMAIDETEQALKAREEK